MSEGVTKMELDLKEGRCYETGIRLEKDDDLEGETPVTKKVRHNNPLTSAQQECKCEAQDHKRVSSKNCPWKGLSKKEVLQNSENRVRDMQLTTETDATIIDSTEPTKVIVQPTGKLVAQRRKLLLRHTNFV